MTLFEAPAYDASREKRNRMILISLLVLLVIAAILGWEFRHWRSEHLVNQFFTAIEHNDLKKAYGIWNNDPDWEKHPERYKEFPFVKFELAWGPASEWGTIRSHKILAALTTKERTGVILAVQINDRTENAFLIYNKKDGTVDFSPVEIRFQ